MNVHQLLALAAVAILLVVVAPKLVRVSSSPRWPLPLIGSLLFLAFSAYTVSLEGPLGFWANHTQDFWGNQVWFDLLIGIGTAFVVLLPRLRAQQMNLIAWFALVLASGSIGLLAMVSRLLFLEEQKKS